MLKTFKFKFLGRKKNAINQFFRSDFVNVFNFLLFNNPPAAETPKSDSANAKRFEKGDKIVTIGGLHGIVDALDEDTIVIKCGDGSRLTYDRTAVREVTQPAGEGTAK